jgi:hypothetical protein
MYIFQKNIKYLKGCIKKWNKEDLGNIFLAKKDLESQMKCIEKAIIQEAHTEKLAQSKVKTKKELTTPIK